MLLNLWTLGLLNSWTLDSVLRDSWVGFDFPWLCFVFGSGGSLGSLFLFWFSLGWILLVEVVDLVSGFFLYVGGSGGSGP